MKTRTLFLIILCLASCVISGCRTSLNLESSSHIQTDSVSNFSHNNTTNLSVLNVHDSVRITDSVRVVVDSMGNVLREFHWHTEKNTVIERGRDTVIIIMRDSISEKHNSVDADNRVEKKVVYKYNMTMIVLIGILAALLLASVYRDIKKRMHG